MCRIRGIAKLTRGLEPIHNLQTRQGKKYYQLLAVYAFFLLKIFVEGLGRFDFNTIENENEPQKYMYVNATFMPYLSKTISSNIF